MKFKKTHKKTSLMIGQKTVVQVFTFGVTFLLKFVSLASSTTQTCFDSLFNLSALFSLQK